MQIKIGIPSNDRLYKTIADLFKEAEIPLVRLERENMGYGKRWKDLEIIYVRCREIPLCLLSEGIDVGITTTNMLNEYNADLDTILDLDFGYHKMVLAAQHGICLSDFENSVVATSYPEITKKFFEQKGIKNVTILNVSGAVEAYPALGLAKGIVDVCETGSSLRANQLEIIEDIEEAHPVLVARKGLSIDKQKKLSFIKESLMACMQAKNARKLVCYVPQTSNDKFMEIYKTYAEDKTAFKIRKSFDEGYELFCRVPKLSKFLKELYEDVNGIGIEIYKPKMMFYQKREN